jgi:hypothetical protein
MTWLAKHRLPSHIRSFSLASIVPPGELARGLTHIGASLRHVDPLNDGQLLFYDQLVPGSELLGYVGADHWAAALPLQERWYLLAGNPAGTHFPRDLLLEAILLRVSEALGGAP